MELKKIVLSIVAAGLVSTVAQADPTTVNGGNVHFKGEFVNAACAVSTDTADQTVNLGQYRTASITAAGQTTTNVPFNIKLVQCDTTVAKTAAIAFNGTADGTDGTLLSINSGNSNAKAATGVGIEILDSKSKTLTPNGSTFSTAQTLIDGNNTLPFVARYKSTAANVTAGQADADATFLVQYN